MGGGVNSAEGEDGKDGQDGNNIVTVGTSSPLSVLPASSPSLCPETRLHEQEGGGKRVGACCDVRMLLPPFLLLPGLVILAVPRRGGGSVLDNGEMQLFPCFPCYSPTPVKRQGKRPGEAEDKEERKKKRRGKRGGGP